MPSIPISTVIFTLNEEDNLPYCLASLRDWCADVIVVDSGSTDDTLNICRENAVRLFEHEFSGFGDQRNWAIDNVRPKNDWILILDADECVSPGLADEMARAVSQAADSIGAFRLRRRFHLWGRWLKYSALYPTWVVRLIHKERVRYMNRGHAETQLVTGQIIDLNQDLIDENRKPIDHWFARQNRYARKEAEYEILQNREPLRLLQIFSRDPLDRRALIKRLAYNLPGRPAWYFVYSYILRGGFLEGKDGYVFCMMRASYQAMIVAKKHDLKQSQEKTPCV